MELSTAVEALIGTFERREAVSGSAIRMNVSRTVSVLAVFYEKVRNAVEFRAEHLVRRASIERILKRRILLGGESPTIADNLILELLWARYIDPGIVDQDKINKIREIIDRYLTVKNQAFKGNSKFDGLTWDDILGLASSEIEEVLVSPVRREALNNFFYHAIRAKIKLPDQSTDHANMQTFIAVERAFSQSDEPLISYHLLKIIDRDWFTGSGGADIKVPLFLKNLLSIKMALHDPVGEQLFRYVRRQTPPFLLLRDLFLDLGDQVRITVSDENLLRQKLAEIATRKYEEIGSKVRRAVVRSFIYIFLTKMVFALALETPYDVYVAKKVAYIPLIINLLFPPVLMVFVAGFISVPGAENTQRLIERIIKILYHFGSLSEEPDVFSSKEPEKRPILTAVFTFFYLITFGLTFFVIHLILSKLSFSWVSQVIFVFFVALVTFFAYRIRQSAKEYEMVEKQGILEPVMDFLFLPILRAGQFLSNEIAKLNLLIFLFDFILEAPLKVIFEVAEEWIRFVRTKKEEII